jgi:hypothetical protein
MHYAERHSVGRQEIACKLQRGSSFSYYAYSCTWLRFLRVELGITLSNAGVHDVHLMEPAVLFLTISSSANANSPLPAPVNTSTMTDPHNQIVEGDTAPAAFQANDETVQFTAKVPHIALRRAEEAVNAMET